MFHISRYTKIFQLVEDKSDVVIGGLFLNIFQGIGKSDILKIPGYTLCVANGDNGAQQ
jgi:hypothetical protein